MTLISAQSTPDHAHHFANLAQIASDNLYTELLGTKANRILTSVFMHPNHEYSYAFTHLLTVDDTVAGMLNGFTAEQNHKFGGKAEWLILRYGTWRFLRYLVIGLLLHELTGFIGKNLHEKDYYIQMVALYPPLRGQGYGKTLLNHAHKVALSQNCRRLVLDVDERNTIAIHTYHKAGLEIVDTSKKIRDGDALWGLLRMAKTL